MAKKPWKATDTTLQWVKLRRQVEIEFHNAQESLIFQKELQEEYGFEPKRGWSKPYEKLPYMSNVFWQSLTEIMTTRAKLDATPLSTETLFKTYLVNNMRPLTEMKWQNFTFDSPNVEDLNRWQKGKLTRLFKGVMSGKKSLRDLTDYMDELDIDFDYEDFRRSYRKD